MKIKLSNSLCDGFGTCANHAPEIFELDDWGYASIKGDGKVPEELIDRVRRAIIDCPVNAIIEVEDDDI